MAPRLALILPVFLPDGFEVEEKLSVSVYSLVMPN